MIYINIFRRYFQWNRSFDISVCAKLRSHSQSQSHSYLFLFFSLSPLLSDSQFFKDSTFFFCRTSSLVVVIVDMHIFDSVTFSVYVVFIVILHFAKWVDVTYLCNSQNGNSHFGKGKHACDSNDDCEIPLYWCRESVPHVHSNPREKKKTKSTHNFLIKVCTTPVGYILRQINAIGIFLFCRSSFLCR